jgi:hypothetical protein
MQAFLSDFQKYFSLVIFAAEKQFICNQKTKDNTEDFHKQVGKPDADQNPNCDPK